MIYRSTVVISASSLLATMFASSAFAAETKANPFEFHAYGRLGITTSEKLTSAGQDQGDGAFGLPTSRHIRDPNYLRVQAQANADAKNTFNLEAQFENLPHQSNSWTGMGVNLRNAYFQTEVSPDAELWFGARRLEFEDVRLFDKFPLSDTTFYGLGTKLSLAGSPTHIAVGFKNIDSPLSIAKDPANPASGNDTVVSQRRDTSLFVRHDISLGTGIALRPTLILNQSGQTTLKGSPLDKYHTASADRVTESTTPKKTLTGKVGATFSHWGDAGWGNHFLWIETRPATGSDGGSEKDSLIGLASSGDYEGWSSSNIGLMYGLMVQHINYKTAQPKYAIENDSFVPNASDTSKTSTVVAVGVQPVYYITERLHAALDINHTLTTKVGFETAKPNMTFVTPILRYASNKSALATPQFYTSLTYGSYESKARQTSSGTPTKTSITTQTGCEFWF
ncbi:hypothetical protein EBU99_09505 [bacterium]|nr:hypothetical protein [bacterium]